MFVGAWGEGGGWGQVSTIHKMFVDVTGLISPTLKEIVNSTMSILKPY
jgi:chromate transport protein ChrA